MSTIRIKRSTSGTAPTGLTFGEPAFVDGINSLYVAKNDGTSLRVGAEISTGVTLGTSDDKIPTQKAVKTYIDNNIAGGSISSLNGLTGAVNIYGGSGVSVAAAAGGITLTNTGVVSAVAGTGISVSAATGAVTFTNTGVQSAVAGNQITVSGATGAVTVAVTATPSFTSITTTGNGTVGGDLVVTGNLTINGTTTTVNSNTMTIDDPVIVLGLSGGVPISVSDGGKSRGIAMSYFDGTAGQTAFIGFESPESTALFAFYSKTNISGDTIGAGSTFAVLQANGIYLQRDANTSSIGRHVIQSQSTSVGAGGRAAIFADHAGYVAMPQTLGTVDFILKSTGSTAQPTWQNPNAAGFTAYAAGRLTPRNIALTGEVTGTVSFDGTADVSISTTIAANSVALGTDTTGNYAQDVSVAGIGLTISGAAGEGTQYIITSGATSANTASQIVARDASGNFTAGTITANLTGNVSGSAATLTTTRSIALGGDLSGSANFNGSADITITAAYVAGSILDADINASAGIVDTKLATISTANKVSLSALDIDGGTVTTTIIGDDLLIVDDGANGTNRKVTVNNLFGSTSTAVVDGGTY
jgi:hypothetical protein